MYKPQLHNQHRIMDDLSKRFSRHNQAIKEKLFRAILTADLDKVESIVAATPKCIDWKKESSGMTPLLYAVTLGNYAVSKYLMSVPGCQIRAEDNSGRTIVDLARISENRDLSRLAFDRYYNDPPESKNNPTVSADIIPFKRD